MPLAPFEIEDDPKTAVRHAAEEELRAMEERRDPTEPGDARLDASLENIIANLKKANGPAAVVLAREALQTIEAGTHRAAEVIAAFEVAIRQNLDDANLGYLKSTSLRLRLEDRLQPMRQHRELLLKHYDRIYALLQDLTGSRLGPLRDKIDESDEALARRLMIRYGNPSKEGIAWAKRKISERKSS